MPFPDIYITADSSGTSRTMLDEQNPPFYSPTYTLFPSCVYILLHIPQQHTRLISPRYFSDPCYIASTVLHTIGSGSGTQRSDEPLSGSVPHYGQPDESETAEHQASHNSHHPVVRYGTPYPPISGLRTTTTRYKTYPNRLPLIPYHSLEVQTPSQSIAIDSVPHRRLQTPASTNPQAPGQSTNPQAPVAPAREHHPASTHPGAQTAASAARMRRSSGVHGNTKHGLVT